MGTLTPGENNGCETDTDKILPTLLNFLRQQKIFLRLCDTCTLAKDLEKNKASVAAELNIAEVQVSNTTADCNHRWDVERECHAARLLLLRTSRERPKSAPYLRLKNNKRTSKCSSI